MPASDFDIYQTESGYVAVTNDVRRQILAALAKKERQLPELVKLTKKAKPTLSSVHMKELLAQKLVEETAHPTDKRKKIYRLLARRIGSSNLPVGELRTAVRQYMSAAPGGSRLPLAAALDAIGCAPAGTGEAILRRQARRLGALASAAFPTVGSPRELVQALGAALEREGLARPLRIDLERLALEIELAAGLAGDASEERCALLLSALLEGALGEKNGGRTRIDAEKAGARRIVLRVPDAGGNGPQTQA